MDSTEHILFICLQREWLAGLRNCILGGARSSFDFCEMDIACVYDLHDRYDTSMQNAPVRKGGQNLSAARDPL